ncbi:MAG: PAS domain S-box protein [Chloroflexi bacterium]|nr:MAG: PAS domain S-box protein [Chloroflexota bacterium]
MRIKFWQWIKPPVFEQEEQSRTAVWLHLMLLSIAFTSIIIAVTTLFISQTPATTSIALIVFIISVIALWFNRQGKLTAATFILLFSLLGTATYALYTGNGIHDTSILFFPAIIIFGGLLLRQRAYLVLVLLVIGAVGFIVFAEVNGWIETQFGSITDYGDSIVLSAFLIVQAMTIELMMGGYLQSLQRAKRNAQAAAESAQTLRALLNASTDPMFLMDTDGHFLDLNEALARAIGRSMIELVGKRSYDMLPPEIGRQRKAIVDKVVATAQPVRMEDHYPGRWLENNLFPILDKNGKVYRVAAYFRDVTSYKKAEEEIRTLNADLEQRVKERTAQLEFTNKELEAFTYSVSHDLRAPLRTINGFARILEEDFGPEFAPSAIEHLQKIRAAGQKMSLLIDNLLDLSRLGRKPLQKQDVDTKGLVHLIIESFSDETAGRQIEWVLGDLPSCHADSILLNQVFANLVGNAVKYTSKRENARVEIGGFSQNEETIYFVRDNGAGFDMQYAEKLFGVFQRMHSDDEFEGTGIGLAIVQRIVQRHGGRVWAEAEVDKGATFFFTLG